MDFLCLDSEVRTNTYMRDRQSIILNKRFLWDGRSIQYMRFQSKYMRFAMLPHVLSTGQIMLILLGIGGLISYYIYKSTIPPPPIPLPENVSKISPRIKLNDGRYLAYK